MIPLIRYNIEQGNWIKIVLYTNTKKIFNNKIGRLAGEHEIKLKTGLESC